MISAVNMSLYVLCNVLFLLALVYSFGVMSLVIWPHSLVKVHTRSKAETVRAARKMLRDTAAHT